METVVRHFVPNPERCHSEAGEAYRQSHDADERLTFVLPHIAECYFKVMLYHNPKF
jgi:hypothetical protein